MMAQKACEDINGLVLGRESQEALKEMADIGYNLKFVATATAFLPIYSIFFNNNALGAAANVGSYDWVNFAQATTSLSAVKRNRLKAVSFREKYNHIKSGTETSKEGRFWSCMYDSF